MTRNIGEEACEWTSQKGQSRNTWWFPLRRKFTINRLLNKLTKCSPTKSSPFWDFPGGTVGKNPSASAGDTGLTPGLGRFYMPGSN